MADIKFLPPERRRVVPLLSRGGTRPSVIADVSNLPAVARRRKLNERLLDGTCAFDNTAATARFTIDDVDLLLLVTRERFGGASALLRRRAVSALAGLDSDAAVARLGDLAVAPVEHDQVRLAALSALPPDRAARLYEELRDDPSGAVREHVRRMIGKVKPERRATPGRLARDPQVGLGEADDHPGCRCC